MQATHALDLKENIVSSCWFRSPLTRNLISEGVVTSNGVTYPS